MKIEMSPKLKPYSGGPGRHASFTRKKITVEKAQIMKRIVLLFLLAIILTTGSYAQKMIGFGGELSVLSFKPNARLWISRNTGFEVFGGLGAQLDDLKPNDLETGFKVLHAVEYRRDERTYVGVQGKWRWVDAFEPHLTTSLPVAGILIGKEWLNKRIHLKGYAVEAGYQFGSKEYQVYSPINRLPIGKERYTEFALILNFRYSFYRKK